MPIANNFNPEIIFVAENTYPALPKPCIESNAHVHHCAQLSIILSGEIHYTVSGETHYLTKGDVILLKPNTTHGTVVPAQIKCSDLHIGLNMPHLFDHFPNNAIMKLTKEPEAFLDCALEIAYERRQHRIGYPLMLKALTMRLLVLLHREITDEIPLECSDNDTCTSTEKKEVVDFMTRYISNHYMNDITLDMFSKDMYLSQAYISKLFKEETGTSPINFLIKTRLSKAKSLLENEQLPIKIVAKQVGYDDVYHFSKLFKKYYGLPPSKFHQKSS